jgi:hypothetical protein
VSRRGLLLAILVYLTLDLSLAEMPGAFVFEPADSVETAQGARFRDSTSFSAPPTFPGDLVPSPPDPPPSTTCLVVGAARDGFPTRVVSCLPRAAIALAPPEDPH